MVEVTVTVETIDGKSTTYLVRTALPNQSLARGLLGKAVELGCAMVDAPFKKVENDALVPRTVQ